MSFKVIPQIRRRILKKATWKKRVMEFYKSELKQYMQQRTSNSKESTKSKNAHHHIMIIEDDCSFIQNQEKERKKKPLVQEIEQ